MITGVLDGGDLYSLTSVPQMPATSIFIRASSSGTSGIGNSRNSVLLGPVLMAARTFSTTRVSNERLCLDVVSTLERIPMRLKQSGIFLRVVVGLVPATPNVVAR